MAYKTDGSCHHNGIKNEKQQIEYLEAGAVHAVLPDIGEFKIERKGGTQYKEDFVIVSDEEDAKVSAKRKKKLSVGSYDYVNSSSVIGDIKSLSEISEYTKRLREDNMSVSTTRAKFNSKANTTLKRLSSNDIKNILIKHVANKNKDMFMMISDRTSNKNYWWKFNQSDLHRDILDNKVTCSLAFGRGKTSAKICFFDSKDNLLEHNLRIRLVLNNGVNALLGKSTSNKTSVPTIKIQQDRCDKLIERLQKQDKVIVF